MKKKRKIWTKIVLCLSVASLLVATFAISASAWTGREDENGNFNNIYCITPLAEILVQTNGTTNNRNVNVNNVLSTNINKNGVIENGMPNIGDTITQAYGEYSWIVERVSEDYYIHNTTIQMAKGLTLTKWYENVMIPLEDYIVENTSFKETSPTTTIQYSDFDNGVSVSYYGSVSFYVDGDLKNKRYSGYVNPTDITDSGYAIYDEFSYVRDCVKEDILHYNSSSSSPDNGIIYINALYISYQTDVGYVEFDRMYYNSSPVHWSSKLPDGSITVEKYEELKDINEYLYNEKEALKTNVSSLQKENALLNNRNNNLSKENTELKAENAELTTNNAELTTNNAELITNNNNLSKENTELKAENAELTTNNAELTTAYKDAKEGLENSNAVLNFFQGIYEAIQGTLNTFFELEVFGFSLGNIVAILLGAAIVIIILKLVL